MADMGQGSLVFAGGNNVFNNELRVKGRQRYTVLIVEILQKRDNIFGELEAIELTDAAKYGFEVFS
jgi:hypothetical protein